MKGTSYLFSRRMLGTLFHVACVLVLLGGIINWAAHQMGFVSPDFVMGLVENGNELPPADRSVPYLRLEKFRMEFWPQTETVKTFESTVQFVTENRTSKIAVNHPLVENGWWIYQQNWGMAEDSTPEKPRFYSGLLCVREVALPLVCVGGLLLVFASLVYALKWMSFPCQLTLPPHTGWRSLFRGLYFLAFLGAVFLVIRRAFLTGHPPLQNLYEFLMCSMALMPILTFLSHRFDHQDTLAVDSILMAFLAVPVLFVMDGHVRHLMPALQSPFFVPHVGAYVLGYLILVRAALGAGKRLIGVGFFLLTLGLVLGAWWSKLCWGHWWQFDPKENWSLATWLVFVTYFHFKSRLSQRGEQIFLLVGAIMIILTLTWVNLSRLFAGMHSYA